MCRTDWEYQLVQSAYQASALPLVSAGFSNFAEGSCTLSGAEVSRPSSSRCDVGLPHHDRQGDGTPQISVLIPDESFRSVYIEMMFCPKGRDATANDTMTLLAKGSGFFYRVDGQIFLITARHNFSGKHWETNDYLHKRYPVAPTHVCVGFRSTPPPEGYKPDEPVPIMLYLLQLLDAAWTPVWREHSRYGRGVDVAALAFRIPEPADFIVMPWDAETASSRNPASKIWVTQDVSVVGYPYGERSGFDLPLWIRGAIASEPALFYPYRGQEYPLFLVDARTRTGQSGSPVVSVQQPFTLTPTDDGKFTYSVAPRWRLLGVYTGRVPDDSAPGSDFGSDLGFVWRIEEVTEICRNGVPGESGPSKQTPE